DAGAVRGRVIGTVNLNVRPLPHQGPKHKRDQMGFRIVVFADGSIGAGAGGVEVAQGRITPTIGGRVVGQGPFHRQFSAPVRVDRSLRLVLGDGNFDGHAVGGTRA